VLSIICIFAWRKSLGNLPTFVKVALPAYAVNAMYAATVFIYVWTLSRVDQLNLLQESRARSMITVGLTLFLLLQWLFAAHYLKSAMLFKEAIT